jgi:hypothetical protein
MLWHVPQGFNAEFESIVNRHKAYTVPDPTLRQRLRQIATDLVVPEYKAFRQRSAILDHIASDAICPFPHNIMNAS